MPKIIKSLPDNSSQELVIRLEININVNGNGVVGVETTQSNSNKLKDLEPEIPDLSKPVEIIKFGEDV